MRAGAGGIVAKGGAEGVQGIGLLDAAAGGRRGVGAVGFVVKVEDGSGRSIPWWPPRSCDAWGLAREAAAVERDHPPRISTGTGAEVARMEAVVEHGRACGAASARRRARRGRATAASPRPPATAAAPSGPASPGKWRLFARKGER